jgi:hypothetical protein
MIGKRVPQANCGCDGSEPDGLGLMTHFHGASFTIFYTGVARGIKETSRSAPHYNFNHAY